MDDTSKEFFSGDLTAQWESTKHTTVEDAQRLRDELLPGKSPEDLGRMIGAPGGSTVNVYADSLDGLAIEATHKALGIEMLRFVRRHGDALTAYHGAFYIREEEQGKGHASRIIGRCMRAYRDAGITLVTASATGGPGRNEGGYYVWPRLGFNMAFNNEQLDAVEGAGYDAADTHELFLKYRKNNIGREWWKKYGSKGEVVFDTDEQSTSSQVLSEYLKEKEIDP